MERRGDKAVTADPKIWRAPRTRRAVGLRALGFGARVIDVLDREIELVLMPLRIATVLAAAVGQYP